MDALRILLIGNGGREHAIAWKLNQSPKVDQIWVAPGNGGTAAGLDKVSNVNIAVDDFPALIEFAKSNSVNFVVPGPEVPCVKGIESVCRRAGLRCFGPSQAAARMEGSKVFAKAFMARHHIPTARFKTFTNVEHAKSHLEQIDYPVVIKADGLAAGKGVVIPENKAHAFQTLASFMSGQAFGASGKEVVIEEYLEGQELSILSFCDGWTLKSLPPAQDHKQIYDGDKGPMTGGMGCYAPTKLATPALIKEIHHTILQPTIDCMRREKFPFVGCLFTGLMITAAGPRVLEYNVRFGDPETETLLPLLSPKSDLADIMLACTDHYLDAIEIDISDQYSATVVGVAGGYPGSYKKGDMIKIGPVASNTTVFHAGTQRVGETVTTNGGRVVACTAVAGSLQDAIESAYQAIKSVSYEGIFYRKDIGSRGLLNKSQDAAPSTSAGAGLTYAAAGVSINTGNELVKRIAPLVKSTARPGADASIGGFGGAVDLLGAGYKSPPTLVCAIDGVGTKLNIAHATGKHDTVGIDCVAMNVNDLVVQGAEVLAFLDCYTCGKLDADIAAQFVAGVAAGCQQANCALVGGETAEMPGLFTAGDISQADGGVYDAVGAAIGAIPEGLPILPRQDSMATGDVLLGIASSGVHSNGFSLVRAIISRAGLAMHDPAPWGSTGRAESVGESLLTPTKIYVRSLLPAVREKLILGMAHITGGGLIDNIPRMLPKHLAAEIDSTTWAVPPVLQWLKREGALSNEEFSTTFNTGLGMVCVVKPEMVQRAMSMLQETGETVYKIGKLVERSTTRGKGCVVEGCDSAWKW